MFRPDSLERAVDLQRRSYALLKWLAAAIDRGFISTGAAHDYTTLRDVTLHWIESHYADLPSVARPPRDDLEGFANLFTSYMEGSFDLVAEPGQRLFSPDAHCFCPMCSWLVDIPHLQTKKLGRHEKTRARALQARAVRQLAIELDREIADEAIEALLDPPAVREAAGLVAYAHDLAKRIDGVSEGAVTLALWRSFAWLPSGSPKKGFELTARKILDAEATLVALIA